MKVNATILIVFVLIFTKNFAQVGVGTTTPAAALDVTSTSGGVLVPRVALTSKAVSAPVVNPQGGALVSGTLVWNTATTGTIPNNVIPGFYYWDTPTLKWVALGGTNSNNWTLNGNTGVNGGNTTTAGTNYIGTTDNQNLDIHTNNTYVARFSSLGEFFLGTLNTTLPGDLMNSVGNATFPWAVNGYTSQNGGGVYGSVLTGGTGLFAGVQGEYSGNNANGAGVRGLITNATAGLNFANSITGVFGGATTTGTYKFGVYGSGGATSRSGGVFGNDFSVAMGALGYFSSGALDYAVYGFGLAHGTGTAAGRMSGNNSTLQENHMIGLGIYGGVMGGWVRGLKYGFHTKGESYSLYVDGNGYTNKPLALLSTNQNGERTASYMSTSIKPEITANGKTALQNGKIYVSFNDVFKQLISNIEDIIITATPQGKSQGIYVDEITADGFWIYENNEGQSQVKVAWTAITTIKGEENQSVPAELLASDFDSKMDGVMFNESDSEHNAQSLWWDGTKIRWDKPQVTKVDEQTPKMTRSVPVKSN
ncbi:MAG: hypothetical protein EOO48_04045 [Flavobacterium sp.]|nr:MAG: hypothetical protein EOO48_04045 [Flavobacterium sp.]